MIFIFMIFVKTFSDLNENDLVVQSRLISLQVEPKLRTDLYNPIVITLEHSQVINMHEQIYQYSWIHVCMIYHMSHNSIIFNVSCILVMFYSSVASTCALTYLVLFLNCTTEITWTKLKVDRAKSSILHNDEKTRIIYLFFCNHFFCCKLFHRH